MRKSPVKPAAGFTAANVLLAVLRVFVDFGSWQGLAGPARLLPCLLPALRVHPAAIHVPNLTLQSHATF